MTPFRIHLKRIISSKAYAIKIRNLSQRIYSYNSESWVPTEKKLFTPGPLGTSATVKAALNYDLGSRDTEFLKVVKSIRDKLVDIAGLPSQQSTSVLMQGSGTFAVESVLQSTSNRKQKILILVSGAYGRRMVEICEKAHIPCQMLEFPENEQVSIEKVVQVLSSALEPFASVAVVHCETTSGVLNPIHDLGVRIKHEHPNITFIVDAMSTFGGVVEDFSTVDFLISSANKCLQGVPGFAFVIANKAKLSGCKGLSSSVSLDLYEQWKGLETSGQFRFTPPTHAILGFHQAIKELDLEGGVPARAQRYCENNRVIKTGMAELGFTQFVDEKFDGHIITSFRYPNHPGFNFEEFYDRLSEKGQLIYPGKVTNANCFRIGNIGHLFPTDMRHLLKCVEKVLTEMRIPVPVDQ